VDSGGYRSIVDPQSGIYRRVSGSNSKGGGPYTTSDGKVTFTLTNGYTYKVNVPVTVWKIYSGTCVGTEYAANTEFSVSSGGFGQYSTSILITVE